MELEELVPRQIQPLEPFHATEGFEDHGGAADLGHGGEEVAGEVQFLQVEEVEHVVGELLEVVGRQVELLQVLARVQVADALEVKLVVRQVQALQLDEVLLAQLRDLADGVELQVEV